MAMVKDVQGEIEKCICDVSFLTESYGNKFAFMQPLHITRHLMLCNKAANIQANKGPPLLPLSTRASVLVVCIICKKKQHPRARESCIQYTHPHPHLHHSISKTGLFFASLVHP